MSQSSGFTAFSVYDEQPGEGVLTVAIYINGNQLDSKYRLSSVWVRKEVNKIGKAELTFKAWSTIESGEDTDSDNEEFTPGNSIRIEAGYLNTTTEASIFEGIIISQQLEIELKGEATLKIECRDYFYPATIVPKTTVFSNVSDQKVITTIAGNYQPVSATIGSTSTTHTELPQYNTSDWDFMLQRARISGFCIITEGKEATIDEPDVSASPVYTFSFGDNIIGIKGKMQASKQLSKVQVLAWNSKEQKLVSVSVDNNTVTDNDQGDLTADELAEKIGSNELTLQTSEYIDDDSLKKWGAAKLLEETLKRVQGDISCKGTAVITAGCMVSIENVSKHMDGKAFCGAVEHEIKDGSWQTTASMGYQDENTTGAAGSKNTESNDNSNKISGLQIGKVAQIEEDPSKEYNIQVEIPLFKSDEVNKVWARLATFWASKQYGAFFIPDVGDEVVIGFFDNDPGKPVVLGSVYSSNQAPANTIEKENKIRSIVTKSKLKLEFDEDKKVITLQTPGNNSLVISDDGKSITLTDQNSNKIAMTTSGISIESSKSLTLKAQTNISIEAGTEVAIKGPSAVNIQGANIEAKADIAFTGKGSASAELSAGGQTVVKGAMVMIN